jgi:hypothetical protein
VFRTVCVALVFCLPSIPAAFARADPLPTATLETDRFPELVNATGNAKCNLLISNPEPHAVAVTLTGTLSDFYGSTSEVTASVTVPAGGEARIPLLQSDRKPGIRWLDYTLSFDGAKRTSNAAFVIADPVAHAGGPDEFLFGICSHTEARPAGEQELEIQAAAAAGATVMRIGVPWVNLEPRPDEWRWDVEDRLVDLAARNGMETQLMLGYGPAYATSNAVRAAQADAMKARQPAWWNITYFAAPEDAPWRRYVAAVARRYQGRIRLYEVWNEPDLESFWRGTTDEYIGILRAAHEEIHRIDPKAVVMTGGFATVFGHGARWKNPNLQERVLAEASDAFDVHAFHQHGTFVDFKRAVEGDLRRMRSGMTHSRPLYFNETAISSASIGEKAQALTLVKKMTYAMAQGAIGYTWYDLRNDGTSPTNWEHNYGLLTTDFRPKAAFAAYSEVVRQLRGLRYLGNLDLGSERQAHVFGGALGRTMVWWNEGRGAAEIPVVLRCGNGPVRLVDIMGVARELPQVDGVVLVQPTADPQYLQMPAGAGLPDVAGTLVQLELPAETASGQPLNTTAELANPFARDIKVRLAWRNAAGENTATSVAVPAGGTVRVPVAYGPPIEAAMTQQIGLDFAIADTPWSGTLHYALPVVRVLGDAPPEGREPDWVLDKSSDVVNFCEADPALAAFTWQGPNDLSARIWAWRQDNALHLRIDVRDDVHMQKESAQNMWRGDSVQVALEVPGTQGSWEIGAAQDNDGKILQAAWVTPPGVTGAEKFFSVHCEAIAGGLRYELALPCDRFALTTQAMEQGFRFNLIVNDNDGNLRKGFVRIAPGLGESKDTSAFPIVRFRAKSN